MESFFILFLEGSVDRVACHETSFWLLEQVFDKDSILIFLPKKKKWLEPDFRKIIFTSTIFDEYFWVFPKKVFDMFIWNDQSIFLELVEIWRTLPKSDGKNKFRSLEIFPWNCFCIETNAIICSVILIFIHFKNHKWRILQINVFSL